MNSVEMASLQQRSRRTRRPSSPGRRSEQDLRVGRAAGDGRAVHIVVRYDLASGPLVKRPLPDRTAPDQALKPTRAFKLVEAVRQECRFAILAFARLRTALNETDQKWVFVCAQAMLQHAGQVACFLVPSLPVPAERGEFRQRELEVEVGNVLLVPALREMLERGNETYEDWVVGLDIPHFLEMTVMPQGALVGSSPDVFHRRIDPDSLRFGFRNWSIDLNCWVRELRRLEGACQTWLRGHTPC